MIHLHTVDSAHEVIYTYLKGGNDLLGAVDNSKDGLVHGMVNHLGLVVFRCALKHVDLL